MTSNDRLIKSVLKMTPDWKALEEAKALTSWALPDVRRGPPDQRVHSIGSLSCLIHEEIVAGGYLCQSLFERNKDQLLVV